MSISIINYSFYYKDNQPEFYSWSIGIYNDDPQPVFHEIAEPAYASWMFEKALEKMAAEHFEKYHEMTLSDGTVAISYRKIIEG